MMNAKSIIWALLTVTCLTACQKEENSPVTASKPVNQLPTYRVVSEKIYEPFVLRDIGGTQSGFEYELLNAIAQKQGFQLEFTARPWSVLLNDLKENQADIVSSGMTITPERQTQVDFSQPYFETSTVLLVGKKFPDIKKFSDIKGQIIAIQDGTVQDKIANQYGSIKNIVEASTWLTVRSTISGQSAATLGDLGSMSYYVTKYPEEQLRIVKDENAVIEQLGFAVRKGNSELLDKLNNGLTQVKADGTYDKLRTKWFGDMK